MSFYKISLTYNGARYKGWQIQPNTELTIQGQLNKALSQISKNKKVHSIGSGRTDAGVHALEQIVRVEIQLDIEPYSLLKALNSLLPRDIRVLSCSGCDDQFHPVFGAKEKIYKYYFSKNVTPFCSDFISQFNYDFDISLMKEACSVFIGEHDFLNYFCTGTDVNSTVREIFECRIDKVKESSFEHIHGENYVLVVRGNGFLKQMVRLIMGAILNVGRKKVSIEELQNSLKIKLKDKVGATAPPQGLILEKVKY